VSTFRGGLSELLGLADEHGADAKTHQEQSATAIQQIHAALQLEAIRVNDGDGNDCYESVERMKRGKLKLLLVHQDDTKRHLRKDGDLRKPSEPPQRTSTQLCELVRRQCPDTRETIADDDNPRP